MKLKKMVNVHSKLVHFQFLQLKENCPNFVVVVEDVKELKPID
ncbi:unnamed protein product [Meloidogyne enterolobii]|uniref:Uncharacterized protein n=1 Tax=Meloidogyne enterolobii TaxID=390850 RepID=A0ACB1AN14_MELEN